MSIEMPEATIIARQLDPEIRGKTVAGFALRGCENFQRIGFFNKDSAAFERLVGLTVDSVGVARQHHRGEAERPSRI